MNILMDNPKSVGSDQIVDAVAASHEHPPLIVIDIGTATTMCVVDKHGNYIGGIILPGLARFPGFLSSKPPSCPSAWRCRTVSSEKYHRLHARRDHFRQRDMIDGIIDRMEQELGQPPTVVATGGLSRFITPCAATKSSATTPCC